MARWEHLKFVLEAKEKFLVRRISDHMAAAKIGPCNHLTKVPRLRRKLIETRFTLTLMERIEEKHSE